MTVTNTGSRAGDDVVQLYLHDPVASISQPVRRLRGLPAGHAGSRGSRDGQRSPSTGATSGSTTTAGKFVVEPGTIELYAGDSSTATLERSFEVTR